MTRRSNKDNLVEHPEIDKLEKQLRKQKPKRWPTKQLALTPLKWRALMKKEEIHLLLLLTLLEINPIHPPLPARNDYEIKPQIIALVRQNQFNGLPAEHPLDHIENFEEICSTTRSNGVSADYLKCKLFSFSLGDKASRWLKSLPAHSITTWDEYKAAFINHFYTKQRSISEYIRDCPNHGFNEGNLWNIFYRGIDHKYKLSLDTASNGNFMTKTVDEAKVLIENLAASDCNNCPDYDRSSRTTTSSPDSFQMTELKNMMAQVLKGQLKHINAIEGMSDANEDHQENAWEISLMKPMKKM
ncbi:unnamed protein product [Microthlaspi erraticum]|uniref:Retrotransposon gag domain-containing protein n=1 Tax=Microthlaspi erraticum TaxID=1685480 RepID=A0A6D2J8M3_9BRAS|nr:unnamed protein product [Microthlaspi erraticum]